MEQNYYSLRKNIQTERARIMSNNRKVYRSNWNALRLKRCTILCTLYVITHRWKWSPSTDRISETYLSSDINVLDKNTIRWRLKIADNRRYICLEHRSQ